MKSSADFTCIFQIKMEMVADYNHKARKDNFMHDSKQKYFVLIWSNDQFYLHTITYLKTIKFLHIDFNQV